MIVVGGLSNVAQIGTGDYNSLALLGNEFFFFSYVIAQQRMEVCFLGEIIQWANVVLGLTFLNN